MTFTSARADLAHILDARQRSTSIIQRKIGRILEKSSDPANVQKAHAKLHELLERDETLPAPLKVQLVHACRVPSDCLGNGLGVYWKQRTFRWNTPEFAAVVKEWLALNLERLAVEPAEEWMESPYPLCRLPAFIMRDFVRHRTVEGLAHKGRWAEEFSCKMFELVDEVLRALSRPSEDLRQLVQELDTKHYVGTKRKFTPSDIVTTIEAIKSGQYRSIGIVDVVVRFAAMDVTHLLDT